MPVVSGEGLDETGRVLATAERERREVEPGGPALGSCDETLDVDVCQRVAEHLGEQLLRLLLVEAQFGGPQLEHLAARAQASEWQRRIEPGCDRELERPRQVVEQEGDTLVHGLARDQVVVLEHEHDSLVERGELVDQRRKHDLDGIGAADAERRQ